MTAPVPAAQPAPAADAQRGDGTDETPVTITATVEVTLPAAAIWPDGVPDAWTTTDVLAAVRESYGLGAWMRDWCLTDSTEVVVTAPNQPTATEWLW